MSEGLKSAIVGLENTGLILDTPELVRDAKVLSKRSAINIIQILYSKIQNQHQVSWWTIGALRQKTLYNTARIKEILHNLAHIDLIDQVKIKNITTYSVTKRPFHGIIPLDDNKTNRRRYVGDQYCYRIKADYIDLVLNPHNNRTVFVPAENLHLENLKLFAIILKYQTMIILQAMGNKGDPISSNQVQDYLNAYLNRNTIEDQVEYNLSNIRKLVKLSFVDNIGAGVTSNHVRYNNTWTIINRDTMHKDGKHISMLYALNFDRVRIQFTNKIGHDFDKNNNSFEIIYPKPQDIHCTDKITKDNIGSHGVIVDIK